MEICDLDIYSVSVEVEQSAETVCSILYNKLPHSLNIRQYITLL